MKDGTQARATVSHDGETVTVEGITYPDDKRHGFDEIGWALLAANGYEHKIHLQRDRNGTWRWHGTVRPVHAHARDQVIERLQAAGWQVSTS